MSMREYSPYRKERGPKSDKTGAGWSRTKMGHQERLGTAWGEDVNAVLEAFLLVSEVLVSKVGRICTSK